MRSATRVEDIHLCTLHCNVHTDEAVGPTWAHCCKLKPSFVVTPTSFIILCNLFMTLLHAKRIIHGLNMGRGISYQVLNMFLQSGDLFIGRIKFMFHFCLMVSRKRFGFVDKWAFAIGLPNSLVIKKPRRNSSGKSLQGYGCLKLHLVSISGHKSPYI